MSKTVLITGACINTGIEVNINTVAEMFEMAKYVGLDPTAYLGQVEFDTTTESSYK